MVTAPQPAVRVSGDERETRDIRLGNRLDHDLGRPGGEPAEPAFLPGADDPAHPLVVLDRRTRSSEGKAAAGAFEAAADGPRSRGAAAFTCWRTDAPEARSALHAYLPAGDGTDETTLRKQEIEHISTLRGQVCPVCVSYVPSVAHMKRDVASMTAVRVDEMKAVFRHEGKPATVGRPRRIRDPCGLRPTDQMATTPASVDHEELVDARIGKAPAVRRPDRLRDLDGPRQHAPAPSGGEIVELTSEGVRPSVRRPDPILRSTGHAPDVAAVRPHHVTAAPRLASTPDKSEQCSVPRPVCESPSRESMALRGIRAFHVDVAIVSVGDQVTLR